MEIYKEVELPAIFEKCCVKNNIDNVVRSTYGYLIVPDGTIYSLSCRWTHGFLLACLFPDFAESKGFKKEDIPEDVDDINVFHYQRFELDNCTELPVVRIARGLSYSFNISKGSEPATQEQITAVSAIMRSHDISLADEVALNCGLRTARKALKLLALSDEHYWDGSDE